MQLENLFKKISEVTTDAVLLTKPKLGTHDFFKALQLRLSRFFSFLVLLRGYKKFFGPEGLSKQQLIHASTHLPRDEAIFNCVESNPGIVSVLLYFVL